MDGGEYDTPDDENAALERGDATAVRARAVMQFLHATIAFRQEGISAPHFGSILSTQDFVHHVMRVRNARAVD